MNLPAIPLKLYYQPGRIIQTLTLRKAEGQVVWTYLGLHYENWHEFYLNRRSQAK